MSAPLPPALSAQSAPGPSAGRPKASRAAPAAVAPLLIPDTSIKLTVPFGSISTLIATDTATGKELWSIQVYKIDYIPHLERDVQDDCIKTLSWNADKKQILVQSERSKRYWVDPNTQAVTKAE